LEWGRCKKANSLLITCNIRPFSRDTCRRCVSVSSNKESQGARQLAAEISTGKKPPFLPDPPFAGRVHQLPGWPRKHERARGMMAHCPVSLNPRGGVPFEEERMRCGDRGEVPFLPRRAPRAAFSLNYRIQLTDARTHARGRRKLEQPGVSARAIGRAEAFGVQCVRFQSAEGSVR